jgi:hypothetical protein
MTDDRPPLGVTRTREEKQFSPQMDTDGHG